MAHDLTKISANKGQMLIAALLQLIMAFACAGIAIGLYPILKKHNESLALGAVGFRIIENVFQIVAALALLSLLTLSQESVKANALSAPAFQAAGASLHAVHFWSGYRVRTLRFLPWCSDVLFCILSIQPHSKVAVGLGHRCDHIAFDCGPHYDVHPN